MAVLSASTSPVKANLHSPHATDMMSPHRNTSPTHLHSRPRSVSHTSDTGFAPSTLVSRPSSALSPSKLDIPKAKKAWDRSARPPADSNRKVRVVWEKFDLRRAKAGIGAQAGQQDDAAGESRRSPSKIVKKAKIAASEDVDIDDMSRRRNDGRKTKDFVTTDRERRTSRSSSLRKMPQQWEGVAQPGDVAHVHEQDPLEIAEEHSAVEGEEEISYDATVNPRVEEMAGSDSLLDPEGTMPADGPIPATAVQQQVTQQMSHNHDTQDVTCEAPASHTDTSIQDSPLVAVEDVASLPQTSDDQHVAEEAGLVLSPEANNTDPSGHERMETEEDMVQGLASTADEMIVTVAAGTLSDDAEVSVSYVDDTGRELASFVHTIAELPVTEVALRSSASTDLSESQVGHTIDPEAISDLASITDSNDELGGVLPPTRTESARHDDHGKALLILPSIDDLFGSTNADSHSRDQEPSASGFGEIVNVQAQILELAASTTISELSDISSASNDQPADTLETQPDEEVDGAHLSTTDADMLDSDDDDLSEEGGIADYNDTIKLSVVNMPPTGFQDENVQQEEDLTEAPVSLEDGTTGSTQAENGTLLDSAAQEDAGDYTQQAEVDREPVEPSKMPDEKSILASFVARAAASRAARSTIITRRVSLQNKQDSDAVRQALASPGRQVLEEKDVNITPRRNIVSFGSPSTAMLGGLGTTPSPSKTSASPSVGVLKLSSPAPLLPASMAAKRAEATVESPVRRSSRNVLAKMQAANDAAAAAQTMNKISVRRTEWEGTAIMAEKAAERDLANLLRSNTRKNKEDAVNVPTRIILLKHQKEIEGADPSGEEAGASQVSKIEIVVRVGKAVQWAETIANYREIPARSPDPDAPVRPTGLRKPPASRIRISNPMIAGGAKSTDQQVEKKAGKLNEGQERADDDTVASLATAPKASTQRALKGLRKMKAKQVPKLAKGVEVSEDTTEPADTTSQGGGKRTKAQDKTTAPSLLPMPWSADANLPTLIPQADVSLPRTRLPTPQSSKPPALAFAPSTRSMTKPNTTGDATFAPMVTSKLKSPKKVSLLPMPTLGLGATSVVSAVTSTGLGTATSALGTPARKKAGVRRKRVA